MRTISIRLDDQTDAVLTAHCQRHGLTQTDAIKAAIEQLAGQHRPTPAALAKELGLIGGFRSGQGDLSREHAMHVKARLLAKRARDAVPTPGKATKAATVSARSRNPVAA